jgi:hypothetical protein
VSVIKTTQERISKEHLLERSGRPAIAKQPRCCYLERLTFFLSRPIGLRTSSAPFHSRLQSSKSVRSNHAKIREKLGEMGKGRARSPGPSDWKGNDRY